MSDEIRTVGNGRLRQTLGEKHGREIDEDDYEAARNARIEEGLLVKGQGRAGTVSLAEADDDRADDEAPEAFTLESPEPKTAKRAPPKSDNKPVASCGPSSGEDAQARSYWHLDRRKHNIVSSG
ncbi:hypothetical protein [Sorangium sp. So ce1000]|uniref:hypothetical protein n=1 Tax=Sorangium sp. So ce1000 TaxID=3133325 RepID=UPI003F5ED266